MRAFVQRLPHVLANTLLMLRRGRGGVFEDGLFTIATPSFKDEPRFRRAYAAAKATGSYANWEVRWRIHVHCWAASLAVGIEGDFVECGVYCGGTVAAILDYVDLAAAGKRYWLLDTFSGLDRTQLTEAERRIETGYFHYGDSYEAVIERFRPYPFVSIVRGAVPATLGAVTSDRIAYLHIDMNASLPEIAALEHFWPRMSAHGIVLLDDYGWPRHREQRFAFDRFASANGVEILQLPTGQGLIFRG